MRDAHIRPGELVLDLGAGHGAITAHLVAAGAQVLAFELDGPRAATLRSRFSPAGAQVRVIRADIADLRLPRRPFRVVANPPFAVAVAVLRRLTAPGSGLVRADVIVPTHLARRWSTGRAPGARRWDRHFSVRIARGVPRHAFIPSGPAASVLVIERREGR